MACLEEVTGVTHRLLNGETVTPHGGHVDVDAGADCVALQPVPGQEEKEMRLFGELR